MTNLGIIFSLLIAAAVISYLVFSVSLHFLGGLSAVNKLAGFKSSLSAFFCSRLDKEKESLFMMLIVFYSFVEIFFTIPLLISGFYSGRVSSGILSAIFINSLQALSLYYAIRTGVLNFSTPVWINSIMNSVSTLLNRGRK